jgi:hypothetical protein
MALAKQCARLKVHPQAWKTIRGIMLKKPGKANYSLAKTWRVISLLNIMGKIIEKLAADVIAEFCKKAEILHLDQMRACRHCEAIDTVACLMQDVHQAWVQKQLAGVLFLDVKDTFPYTSPRRLMQRMKEMRIDADLLQ